MGQKLAFDLVRLVLFMCAHQMLCQGRVSVPVVSILCQETIHMLVCSLQRSLTLALINWELQTGEIFSWRLRNTTKNEGIFLNLKICISYIL